jgi:hypothetical protein
MNTATEIQTGFLPSGDDTVQRSVKPVLKLVAAVAAVLFFMLWLGPRLEQTSYIKPMAQFIEERDIEANMYFYTEVEAFSEANINMDNTMKYPPRPAP